MTKEKEKSKKPIKSAKKVTKVAVVSNVPEVELEEDEETPTVVVEELDPEILKALNVDKKKKKIPSTKDIDYIPEFERGDDTFGGNNDF